ncbi:MAG: hypothetical protein H7319_03930 [Spirosoma sp.]|nr:hypothetical protein [Spirosoma sp.]
MFNGTTINPKVIESYASEDPGFLECVIEVNGDELHRKEANHAHYFEHHLRRYIVGKTKTLHRVFSEVRQFRAFDEDRADIFIPILIDRVEETIWLNEWYELMPCYEQAKQKVLSKFELKSFTPISIITNWQ